MSALSSLLSKIVKQQQGNIPNHLTANASDQRTDKNAFSGSSSGGISSLAVGSGTAAPGQHPSSLTETTAVRTFDVGPAASSYASASAAFGTAESSIGSAKVGIVVTLLRASSNDSLGILVDKNLVITSVMPNSPASRAGIPLRHRIVVANDRLVTDLAAFQSIVQESQNELTLRVVPMRLRNELNESVLSDFLVSILRGEELDIETLRADPDYEFLNEGSKFHKKYLERRAEVLQAKAALDALEAKITEREQMASSGRTHRITDQMYDAAIKKLDAMLREKQAADRALESGMVTGNRELGWVTDPMVTNFNNPTPVAIPQSSFNFGAQSSNMGHAIPNGGGPAHSLIPTLRPSHDGGSVSTSQSHDPLQTVTTGITTPTMAAANIAAILESLPMLGGIAQPYSGLSGKAASTGAENPSNDMAHYAALFNDRILKRTREGDEESST